MRRVKMDRFKQGARRLSNCYTSIDLGVHRWGSLRFDDSLETVLGADIATPFGAQSMWRQLTDLMGRGRVAATPQALAQLRTIRALVPATVRTASARSLAFANPPAELVRLFGEDEPPIAAPVLSTAQLDDADWLAIIPDLPAGVALAATPSSRLAGAGSTGARQLRFE